MSEPISRHRCDWFIGGMNYGRQCKRSGPRLYAVMCVHEHLIERHVCVAHLRSFNDSPLPWLCRPCFEVDGHHCPAVALAVAASVGG